MDDSDVVGTICRIKAGRAQGERGIMLRWSDEVKRLDEILKIDQGAGIIGTHSSGIFVREEATHRFLEAILGLVVDLTARRLDGRGWDMSCDSPFKEAKRKVARQEGVLLLGGPRHVAKRGRIATRKQDLETKRT